MGGGIKQNRGRKVKTTKNFVFSFAISLLALNPPSMWWLTCPPLHLGLLRPGNLGAQWAKWTGFIS